MLVAASPLVAGVGGRYFEDCQEAGVNQPGTRTGVAAYALDPEAAGHLLAGVHLKRSRAEQSASARPGRGWISGGGGRARAV